MGQKIKPNSYRLGIIGGWHSRWFSGKSFKERLEEDMIIRQTINDKLKTAGIVNIDVERTAGDCRVIVKAARPGLIIGRGGKGIEALTKLLNAKLKKLHHSRGTTCPSLALSVEELKRSEIAAANVAQNIVFDLEKRLPFRRVMKKYIDSVMQNREAEGVKIKLSGRLGGAEIARREWLAKGKLPLQTLRANIDYGEATAFTTYGTVGVKVWIYKGEVFDKDKDHVNS